MELAQNCDEEIKKAFQKLVRFEKRVTKSLGALHEVLEAENKDADFNRIKAVHDEAEKVFKNFEAQLSKSKDTFDEHCKADDDDAIYDRLIHIQEKMSEEYAKAISLYEKAKPAPPLTERAMRLKKYREDRDDMEQIKRKKEERDKARMKLNNTDTELKEIEEQFNKLKLAGETELKLAGETEDERKDQPAKTVKTEPANTNGESSEQLKREEMFNYNSTPKLNLSEHGQTAAADTLFGDLLTEKLQTMQQVTQLQEALIQQSLLPPVTVESFDGDPLMYRSFKYNFDNTVMKVTKDPATQVSHLISRCTGDALNAIRNKVVSGEPKEALDSALAALEREFGQKETLVRSAKAALKDCPQIDGSYASLRRLSCSMENLCDVMTANNCTYDLNGAGITTLVFKKFTPQMQSSFNAQQRSRLVANPKESASVTFQSLLDFVRIEAKCANTTFATSMIKNQPKQPEKRGMHKNQGHVYAGSGSSGSSSGHIKKEECRFCRSKDHKFHQCQEFLSLDAGKRYNYFKRSGLCFICSGKHLSKECTSKYTCKDCKSRHHITLPCRKQVAIPKKDEQATAAVNVVKAVCSTTQVKVNKVRTFVPVLPAIARVGNRTMRVNIFLDGGATITTATKRVQEQLNPATTPTTMKLSGLHQKKVKMNGCTFSMFVKGIGEGFTKEVFIKNVNVLDGLSMPDFTESFPTTYDLSNNPLLNNLPFVEAEGTSIDLLVGRDVPALHQVLEDRCLPEVDMVHACKSPIGWYLSGPSCRSEIQKNTKSDPVTYALAVVHEPPDVLEDHLARLERYDFSDPVYSKTLGKSRDDLRAQKLVEDSIQKTGKTYSIALTWRDEFAGMPDNRVQAERRLKGLIPQFKRNPDFHRRFAEKMAENIKNHAEEVTPAMEENAIRDHVNHVAQFGVESAKKFRVVNDAAAKSLDGKSINDRLLPGEDILTSLNSVLLRSRQHPFLFVADIKSMFLSVEVDKKDRDALRFLWFEDGDYEKPIKTYRWKKWCFGLNSAPYAATKALRQTALDNDVGETLEVVNIIFNNTYVDDIIKSCRTVEEGNKLAKGVINLCSSGNFELAKFQANNDEILKGISPERIAATNKEKSMDFNSESTKVLGMHVDFK